MGFTSRHGMGLGFPEKPWPSSGTSAKDPASICSYLARESLGLVPARIKGRWSGTPLTGPVAAPQGLSWCAPFTRVPMSSPSFHYFSNTKLCKNTCHQVRSREAQRCQR